MTHASLGIPGFISDTWEIAFTVILFSAHTETGESSPYVIRGVDATSKLRPQRLCHWHADMLPLVLSFAFAE